MVTAHPRTTAQVDDTSATSLVELNLSVSTTIMLRSIAEIVRTEGEHIHRPETQMACFEVFALGKQSESDDAADTGYMGSGWP